MLFGLFFHVLQLLVIYIYTTNIVLHQWIYDEELSTTIGPPLIYIVTSIISACLLIPSLNILVLPIMFTIECGVNKIWECGPISFKHVSIWCLFFDPHLTTHQSNIRVRSRKKHSRLCSTMLVATKVHVIVRSTTMIMMTTWCIQAWGSKKLVIILRSKAVIWGRETR
jgi:hypothetical protein